MRVGVIGVGVMGSLYARLLTEMPHAQLCGVADSQWERAERAGALHNVSAFEKSQDLIQQAAPEAVIIATDEDQHLEPVRLAAQAGLPILLEKPLASTVSDGRAILQEIDQLDVPLLVGHTLRFDPRYAAARESIRKGELGDLVHITARRNGSIANAKRIAGRCTVSMFLGVHDIDFMLWTLGQAVTEVRSVANQKVLHDFGVHDSILSLLKFQDGTIGMLETSWISPVFSNQFEAVGSKGFLQVVTPDPATATYGQGWIKHSAPLYQFDPLPTGLTLNVYQAEVMHFLDGVLYGRPFIIQPKEALAAVSVAEAIDRSVSSGRPEKPVVNGSSD